MKTNSPMQVPSGVVYTPADIDLLLAMSMVGFVRHSDTPFKLKSGIMSHVYVFGREDLTDHPELALNVGRKITSIVYQRVDVDDTRQQCLIGIPTAGNALAAAGSLVSVEACKGCIGMAQPIGYRIMREKLKQYGAHPTWVNGTPDLEKHRYWMVDNVATDGQSKLEAAEKLEADGYPAKQMPCLIWVDRQQGAIAKLAAAGFRDVIVAFNLLDMTYAFGELGVWPSEAVKAVEAEIKEHQFVV